MEDYRPLPAEQHLAALDQPSEPFNNFYYWFFSQEKEAASARARCDVPYALVTGLTGRELEVAKHMIYDTLTLQSNELYFYLNVIRALEDREAVPALKQTLAAGSRTGSWMEKKACLETLYVLTNNLWYWLQGLLVRPRI